MPGKLRRLSGREIASIFADFGFVPVAGGRGSHLKLRRVLENGSRQTLILPDHKEIDRATLASILRKASAYIPADELRARFHAD